MSDKLKYIIVEGNTGQILQGAVNRKIEEGYEPIGSVVYCNCLLQPMILNESNTLIKINPEKK